VIAKEIENGSIRLIGYVFVCVFSARNHPSNQTIDDSVMDSAPT
jgi:hypothetical protein